MSAEIIIILVILGVTGIFAGMIAIEIGADGVKRDHKPSIVLIVFGVVMIMLVTCITILITMKEMGYLEMINS